MKTGCRFFPHFAWITLALITTASAQVVSFVNQGSFPTLADRLVYRGDGGASVPLVGTNYVAQLFYGTDRRTLVAVTNPPAQFRMPSTSSPGTWVGGTRTLVGFSPGQTILMQVRVWDTTWSPPCHTHFLGASAPFTYTIPPLGAPSKDFLMDNLRGFTLTLGCGAEPLPLSISETNGQMQLVFGTSESVSVRASSNLFDRPTISTNALSPFIDSNAPALNARYYSVFRFFGGSVDYYSTNTVGFYRLNIPAGYSFLGNHLRLDDDRVTSIFPMPPNGTQVFSPNAGAYQFIVYVDGAWEGDNLDMRLPTGGGVIFWTPEAFTKTFVGEILFDSLTELNPRATGFNLVSSVLPQSLPLTGAGGLNFPVAEGDVIYQFDRDSGGYRYNQYIDKAWEGDAEGNPPVPALGECFWVYKRLPAYWARYFGL